MSITLPDSCQALDRLAGRLTLMGSHSPATHPHDTAATAEALAVVMVDHGNELPQRDAISTYLETKGLDAAHARDVGLIYEGMRAMRGDHLRR